MFQFQIRKPPLSAGYGRLHENDSKACKAGIKPERILRRRGSGERYLPFHLLGTGERVVPGVVEVGDDPRGDVPVDGLEILEQPLVLHARLVVLGPPVRGRTKLFRATEVGARRLLLKCDQSALLSIVAAKADAQRSLGQLKQTLGDVAREP